MLRYRTAAGSESELIAETELQARQVLDALLGLITPQPFPPSGVKT
jgi:hypothetical protein